MAELKAISGRDVESARISGQNKKATTVKMDIALLQALTEIASEEGGYGAKIRLIESSIRNGLFYKDHLKRRVEEYLRINKPLRDEYVERFDQSPGHVSYIDGSPILLSDYVSTSFIVDAINEKIDREDSKAREAADENFDPRIYGMDKRTFTTWKKSGWRKAFKVDDAGVAHARRGIGKE